MSLQRIACLITVVLLVVISSSMSHPVSGELSDDVYDRLKTEEAILLARQVFKRGGRMGWRKCNPLFNFRCGKKTVFTYRG